MAMGYRLAAFGLALSAGMAGTAKEIAVSPDAGSTETFTVKGREAFVVLPADAAAHAPARPWVWYAPTLPGLPDAHERHMIETWLAAGVAVAGIDIGESYGSPDGRALCTALYDELVGARGFSPKPCLLVRSRGGLMLYNWAVEHPGAVAGIAGIYPVCDLTSYPGAEKAAGAYRMTPEELRNSLDRHNPVNRLRPLAEARVPILHIHGDSDTVVPLERNSGELARRYTELGGPIRLIVPEGQGHNLWQGFFRCEELVDFVIEQARAGAAAPRSPIRIERNRFVDRATGKTFVPRGFNYIRLDLEGQGGHATFSPFVYDRERMGAALRRMAEGGFNVVRVFINGFRGRRGTLLERADSERLSPVYLDNLADFLLQARQNGIGVIPCFEVFPEAGPYREALGADIENIEGWARHYLHPGYIAAKEAYLRDVIRELRRRDPGTIGAVFCWDVMNEVCYPLGEKPFSLAEGRVTPANGVTYDLATDRERLADDMAVYWIDRMAAAIRAEVPDALINANVFTYHAVGRTGPGDFDQDPADWKNRYPFRPRALLASTADVIDLHFYCANADGLQADLRSVEFAALKADLERFPRKALLVGEFGAFKNPFPDCGKAADWMADLAGRFAPEGFAGWVHWTYDCDEQTELWNGLSEDGLIFRALSETAEPGAR